MQWVTNVGFPDSNAETALAAATLQSVTLVGTGTSQVTIAGDTFLMPQRSTIMRIVGDFSIRNTSASIAHVTMGVLLFSELAGANINYQPNLLANADLPWLYLRNFMLEPVGAAGSINSDVFPAGNHIDIRVKRVIKPDQRCSLFYLSDQSTAWSGMLRVLMGRVA